MENKALTIVARFVAKEGKLDLVKSELTKLIDVTRTEEGCISYDLHQDNNNPNLFLFFERWENREIWQKHTKNPPLAAFSKATDGALAEFIVQEMTHID